MPPSRPMPTKFSPSVSWMIWIALALQQVGDPLGLDVVLGGERQEHQLLEAQVAAHLLGVTPSHDGVSELPWGEHNLSVRQFQFLQPVQPELAPELGRLYRARFLRRASRFRGPHFRRSGRRLALPFPERLVFSRVREQEIEQGNHANGEEESSRIDRRRRTAAYRPSRIRMIPGRNAIWLSTLLAFGPAADTARFCVLTLGWKLPASLFTPLKAPYGIFTNISRYQSHRPSQALLQLFLGRTRKLRPQIVGLDRRQIVPHLVDGDVGMPSRIPHHRGDHDLNAQKHLPHAHRISMPRGEEC